MTSIVTCIAPVNIAVIKYWGKRDENLILPLNDSLSTTFSTDQMHAKTTVMSSPAFTKDKMWLNGKEQSFDNPRLVACLREIRRRAPASSDYKVHICSENNFPTAAGLASSAAGYACLVYSLAKVFGVEGDVSAIARQGSGSACRSLYGGFVRWHKGSKADGADSYSEQVYGADHWPDLRVLILVVNDSRKKVGSTPGMQITAETSELLKHRVNVVVPHRVENIIEAIGMKDFPKFAELTIKDSNNLHAVILDSYPPCTYLNDISYAVMDLVHCYNKSKGINKVAYTFDAGPNACLYLLEQDVPEVMELIKTVFPPHPDERMFFRGVPEPNTGLNINREFNWPLSPYEAGTIKYVIHTKIGTGPQVLEGKDCHLLNEQGLPKNLISSS